MKNRITVRELCHIAIFTAIIAVCSQISVPLPYGVPLTLQTFAVMLAGMVLGKKNGVLSVIIYVLLGIAGVPVFSGFAGGMGVIFGKTGGFILSFPLMALCAGIGNDKNNYVWLAFWLIIGAVINYIGGMLMFAFVTSNTLAASFGYVVLPFIPTGAVKIIMAAVIGKQAKNILVKNKILMGES